MRRHFAVFCLLLASISYTADQTIKTMVEKQLPGLVATYQQLHAAPELAYFEKNTAAFMAEKLKNMGYQVTERFGRYENPNQTCYGIVALMKNGAGPTVLFRADMDALPIEEKTSLPYASKVVIKNDEGEMVPVMHACGHDLHCTVLLGIADVLRQCKSKWKGTLMLIVQPAEEVNDSGGYAMMRAGLYEKFFQPNYALAYHVNENIVTGDIQYIFGNCLADFTDVDIIV